MHLRRTLAALTAAVTVGILGSGLAQADDISNRLDASIDTEAEVMPLNVGGQDGTTKLYVSTTNGDGKNGCNLTGSTTLTLSISSSDAAVATVSPSSVTFTSCGDEKVLTVTPVAQGTATISASQTSNTTEGTFNLAPATFTVNVTASAPANTAPTVSITGVTGGASYPKGSVPEAICSVVDAEDGNSTFPAALSVITGPYASDGIGSQTASCSYTDAGGLTASASQTYSIADQSAPVIGYALSPSSPDGDNGWYHSNVTLTWTVTEDESPNSLVKTGCVDQDIASDQDDTTYSCSAISAGGTADTVTTSPIKRDATDPTAAFDSSFGQTYYYGQVPAAPTCTASDATSGPAGCEVTGYSTAVGEHTLTATAKDNAGNSGTTTLDYEVLAWALKGFYQPVDMNGVVNTVKGGSTVPLKFEVFAGDNELTDVAAVKTFKVGAVSCTTLLGGPVDDIEQYTSGATVLRYDATGGQFIQNWQTPKSPGACYKVTMTTQDGSAISTNFKLK